MTDFILKPLAQEILDLGGGMHIPEDRGDLQLFAEDISCSDGFGYGLFAGGYIHPADIIADSEQLKELDVAIKLVDRYRKVWEQIATEV